jgi:RNA polymerase sigma-70 factor, ECF subfamily
VILPMWRKCKARVAGMCCLVRLVPGGRRNTRHTLNSPPSVCVPGVERPTRGNPRTPEVGVRKDSAVADERLPRARHRMSQPSEPDEELMRALYREHAGPLLAYVLRLVAGDRQRAEDVVQETLIRAWKNAGQLNRATGSVRPWLVTVARRIVIDGHRSRQARPQEVDPSPLEVIPAEDEIDKALWLMTLSDALDDLTPAHREVLVETYFKGRTVNEAAETLGIPSGTVRSRVFYALRSMKLALEERGVTA